MDVPSGFGSTSSVRYRVLRNVKTRLQRLSNMDSGDLPPLQPGQMQLYSFYTPGLTTGLYTIRSEQYIDANPETKTISAPAQTFLVDAPRFTLDPALVHSVFPLAGVSAHSNILPHVVFNDPHLPWQTAVGPTSEEDTMRIPWVAVITFEQSELDIPDNDPLFPSSFQGNSRPKESLTNSYSLSIEEITTTGLQCALPDLGEVTTEEAAVQVEAIFPKMDLFRALFADSSSDPKINLDRYKYLGHARQVNTEHMTDAGVLEGGTFSVVFSHRTGPLFAKGAPVVPKRCVTHLVSLDWVHHIPDTTLKDNARAALISLYSWTYDCLPPETINFEDVMRAVGKNSDAFATPNAIKEQLDSGLPAAIRKRMQNRVEDGYTMVRYRVQTGEETVALMRGPLTPHHVPDATWMDVHSNSGEDLQIIDREMGIIDISYCAAWQLGKALAIADQAFCASLLRIRSDVHNSSAENTKQDIISSKYEPATSARVIASLPDTMQGLQDIAQEEPSQLRWNRPSLIQSRYELLAKPELFSAGLQFFEDYLRSRVEHLTSASDGTHFTEAKPSATSTDWEIVLNWLLDKIYLAGIPPYYLIPDPLWLPSESIRFFYVDQKWLSCLVDGALSVSNHLDHDDRTRQSIKDQLLKYLNEDVHPDLKHPPQIPTYGFYLRSVAVSAFPDMVVRAPRPQINGEDDERVEILRQDTLRKDLMIGLLDRTPDQLNELIFSQPPHQQCFAFGAQGTLTDDAFRLELRKVFSVQTTKNMDELPPLEYTKDADGRCEIYDWNTRLVLMDKLVEVVSDALKTAHETDSDVYTGEINASVIGLEFNEPIYRLTFHSKPEAVAESAGGAGPGGSAAPSEAFILPSSETLPPTAPIPKNYARPFKRRVVREPRPRPTSRLKDGPAPSIISATMFMAEARLEGSFVPARSISILHEHPEYDDMDKCDPRYDALCFSPGHMPRPTPSDAEPKPIVMEAPATDIIVRLVRNTTDVGTTDFIDVVEVQIPVGTTPGCLLSAHPQEGTVLMLSDRRCFIRITRDDETGDAVIQVKPKSRTELTPVAHNTDVSFSFRAAPLNPNAQDVTVSIVELFRSKEGNGKVAFNSIKHVLVEKA